MGDLEGKVAIVTAGGTGLGRCISLELIRQGCAVSFCHRRASVIEEATKEFEAMGANVFGYVCDVANEEQVQAMVAATMEHFGRIDILVNNVGAAGPICNLVDMDIKAWNETIETDLNGTMLMSKYVLREMIKAGNGGSIIMIGAEAGTIAEGWGGYPLRASYSAVKNAVRGLQSVMAIENGKYGIRVNTVKPAAVEGERMMRIMEGRAKARGTTTEHELKLEQAHYSLRRFTKPEEVAYCVEFLASDRSAAITNQVLVCSCGLSLMASDMPD
ncbi:MAG: SDR family oxidoreductase [Lachnospiraceae bacterium]|nr:SDR family oxidoreductase [Lachnospiraceae bacterium]